MAIIRRITPGFPGPGVGWGKTNEAFSLLRNEMDRLFEDYFGRRLSPAPAVFPPVNLYEDNDAVYLTAELPGMEAKDIELRAELDNVQIKGERSIEPEDREGYYHRRERQGGSFNKKVILPTEIATDKVAAEMNNGVLKITMPKAESAKPRKIEIKTS